MIGLALRSELVTDGEALAALEQPWWRLWWGCPAATPFQTPAWLLPWWRRFAPGALRAIAVWQGPRLVGLAPFYLECGAAGRRLLPVGISLSDYLDVLIDPACGGPVAEAITDRAVALGWDSWELEELAPGAAALALAGAAAPGATMSEQSACPVIPLAGGDDLAGCVPARRRRQLRRAHASAGRCGTWEIKPMHDSAGFVEALANLHGARWATRGAAGVLHDPVALGFHREALVRLDAAGLARCRLLRIGGILAAAYYGMATPGRAYAYLGGFDPAFAEDSPGSILIGHAIAEALREGATEFHFLRGREDYKYSWGAVDRWNRRLAFRRSAP